MVKLTSGAEPPFFLRRLPPSGQAGVLGSRAKKDGGEAQRLFRYTSRMTPFAYALASTVLVSAVSFVGITLFLFNERLLQRSLTFLLSFSTGAFIGEVFLHIFPEMTEGGASLPPSLWFSVIAGLLLSFVLEKFIHWRHCHDAGCADHAKPVGIMNLVGDLLHNAIDGMAIAATYLIGIPLGIATTVAVILHEIPQEFGDTGILLYSGFSRRSVLLLNGLTACSAILGAVLVFAARPFLPLLETLLVPLTAGSFLYIAGSDLIPELHRENGTAQSLLQFSGIMLGVAFMAALRFVA